MGKQEVVHFDEAVFTGNNGKLIIKLGRGSLTYTPVNSYGSPAMDVSMALEVAGLSDVQHLAGYITRMQQEISELRTMAMLQNAPVGGSGF